MITLEPCLLQPCFHVAGRRRDILYCIILYYILYAYRDGHDPKKARADVAAAFQSTAVAPIDINSDNDNNDNDNSSTANY